MKIEGTNGTSEFANLLVGQYRSFRQSRPERFFLLNN